MRLPVRQEGPVQELVGVDPGVYAQRGQAAAQLGASAGQIAVTIKQRRDAQDLHAGKLAGHEQRQQTAALVAQLEAEDYLPGDSELLEGVEGYTTRPDGSVMTSEVAAEIYALQAKEYATANAETMNKGKIRDLWVASQEAAIAERTAEITIRAGKVAQRERKIEDARIFMDLVDSQDWAGARHAVKMSGWTAQEKADRRAALKIHEENSNVDNAILSRDLGAIDEQIELMGMPQDEYPGELNTNARINQRQRLKGARKGITAGNVAHDKATRAVAVMKLKAAQANYYAGGETSPGQLFTTVQQLAPAIGIPSEVLMGSGEMDYTGMDVADARMVYEIRQTSKDFENFELIASGTLEAVAEHMGDLKRAANDGGAEDALRYQRALDYQDKMEAQKRNDPLTLADRHGITGNRAPFDINDINSTLPGELSDSRTASTHYGVPNRIVSDNTLQQLQDLWDTSGIDDRLVLLATINSHLPDSGAKHTFWADRMSNSDSGAAWVAGDVAEVGAQSGDARSIGGSRGILQGQAILDNPDNEILLKSKKWGSDDRDFEELDIAPEMHRLYPLDHQARTKAVMASATHQIMRGTDTDRAVRRAMNIVNGGPLVANTGGGPEVRPPTPRMSEDDFQRGQQGASDDYYESVGFIRDGIRESVINGDIAFENTGMEPGTYYLRDTNTGLYVVSDPPGAIVQWDQMDDVGPARSRLSRSRFSDEEARVRDEFRAESKARTEEAKRVMAAHQVAQREKELQRKADQRRQRMEEKGVPLFPWGDWPFTGRDRRQVE